MPLYVLFEYVDSTARNHSSRCPMREPIRTLEARLSLLESARSPDSKNPQVLR